ncbi:MAG: hypothetical protein KME30_20365 [Iphinoe sp. HA4291-MV1]|jgi:hypothetical protein|nr:hypothetical protein [Iphinoe sp. HA4291-MV1]
MHQRRTQNIPTVGGQGREQIIPCLPCLPCPQLGEVASGFPDNPTTVYRTYAVTTARETRLCPAALTHRTDSSLVQNFLVNSDY